MAKKAKSREIGGWAAGSIAVRTNSGKVIAVEDLMSLTTAAKVMGYSRSHLGTLAHGGSRAKAHPFLTVRIDGTLYTTQEWIDEFIEASTPISKEEHWAKIKDLVGKVDELQKQLREESTPLEAEIDDSGQT